MQSARIYLEDAGEYLSALFDSQQLTRTIVNLLLNALEASPAGGTVRVQTSAERGVVRVAVQDEGSGLNSEEQQHLFEPFYTTKPAGTGLGLAVSRELMRGQSGDLLYSALPIGARGPLLKVNCAAIPESLLESELFGHEKRCVHERTLRAYRTIRRGTPWNSLSG